VRVISADRPRSGPRVVLPRQKQREYSLEHRASKFYLLVNDTGSNFRLVETDTAKPSIAAARELIAHRPAVMLEGLDLFAGHMVVRERDQGVQKLRVWDFANSESHHIGFDEKVYSAKGIDNAEFHTTSFRLDFSSLVTPNTVYDYDMHRRALTLKKRQAVLGGYDRKLYESEQIAEVPFVDVINTMLDETLPLTVGEFLEWGNPKVRADYEVMRRYSPYDNLKPGAYPAIYVRTSLNDSQVPYWEAAKLSKPARLTVRHFDKLSPFDGLAFLQRVVRGQAARLENRSPSAVAGHQSRRRPRRGIGALRRAEGKRARRRD